MKEQKLKTYEVKFYYNIEGITEIEAFSPEQARRTMMKILEEEGVEDEAEYDITNREFNASVTPEPRRGFA
jgi:pimeloyl-CoA synthetase